MSTITRWVQAHWKAIGGALGAGGFAIVQAAAEDGITAAEWRGILIATLAGAGITWAFPANKQDVVLAPKDIVDPNQGGKF